MNISFYFRKQSPVFHSIEEQFFAMQENLPKYVVFKNQFAKYHSKGFFKRMFICFEAISKQGKINHITGDIHFVSYFLKKKKTILTIHDIGSILKGNSIKIAVLKFFWFSLPAKRVSYITVISEFTKMQLLENVRINPEKIVVIPDCVSSEINFSKKEFNSEKPLILQIGTKSNKNLPVLFKAIKGMNCRLLIVGKLSNEQILMLENYKIDYENKCNLNFSEIVELYKKCDIVSFISTYEGFGVPILEAQATGRVVITSNLSPMKEVAGENALLVNPYNFEEIREALESIILNQDKRNRLIEAGLENVKKYSAKIVAEKYYKLYCKIFE